MKYFLLLFVSLPLLGFSQYPVLSFNWEFHTKQKAIMKKYGYRRMNCHEVGKWDGSGKIFKSFRNWQAFDSSYRFIKRGNRNGGKDTVTYERFYSAKGLLTGDREFDIKRSRVAYGRDFIYDEKDSLIEIKRMPSGTIQMKYEYTVENDSTTLVSEYSDSAGGLEFTHTKKVVREKNAVTIYDLKGGKITGHKKTMYNENKQPLISTNTYGTKELYEYDKAGRMVSKEIQYSSGHGNTTTKFAWTYNTNGDLLKQETFSNGKIKEKNEYIFKGPLLTQHTLTHYYSGWEEGGTYTFTYYKNGLLATAYCHVKDVNYTFKFTYE
jgi:YD repeat-containing protein